MINLTITLRHLTFCGPVKAPASIKFEDGFNLIYGSSNTGKSSILDAIDFMLGRSRKLKELPEHVGYAEIFLGLQFSDGSYVTLRRSIDGGDYDLFDGLHSSIPENIKPSTLKEKKSTKKLDSLSDYILKQIGLKDKYLKRNVKNQQERLSIRTLLPLFFISETNIQKEISPFRTPQYTKETMETSRLKLILTGVDDSALKVNEVTEREVISRTARVGMLEELIEDINVKISDTVPADASKFELEEQFLKLEYTIEDSNNMLSKTEENFLELVAGRNSQQLDFERDRERLAEISDMIARFELLMTHYDSDLERLVAVIEAGSLFSALSSKSCPLCGALEDSQNLKHQCDANSDDIVEAAQAECNKINILVRDLQNTLSSLQQESEEIGTALELKEVLLEKSVQKVNEAKPDLAKVRHKYAELFRKQTLVEKSIELFVTLDELEDKLSDALEGPDKPKAVAGNRVPTAALFDLAKSIKSVLSEWKLPNSDDLHFDHETSDIVLNGKHRIGNGKGHRSITHAAVTIGLAKFLSEKKLPSLGFVVLDSPLLAYEEPDEKDGISETDLNRRCFDFLNSMHNFQTIIFENRKSVPSNLDEYDNVTYFTKSEVSGRYGFFPR